MEVSVKVGDAKESVFGKELSVKFAGNRKSSDSWQMLGDGVESWNQVIPKIDIGK
jgi:hypothetical protein